MSALYGWIVTKDFIAESVPMQAWGRDFAEVNVIGPRTIAPEIEGRLQAGDGQSFRLFDDDGMLYYEGLYIGPDHGDLFAPLDDYGKPNAGAVSIEYLQHGQFVEI